MPSPSEKFLAAAFKLLFKLLSTLPFSLLRGLGSFSGNILWLLNSKLKKTTIKNIQLCYPNMSPTEQTNLAKKSLIETCKLIFELSPTWIWDIKKCEQLIQKIHNEKLIKTLYNKQQGTIIVLPHLGNWEIIGAYLGIRYPITALYQPPKQKLLEDFLIQARERYQVSMVATNAKGVLQLAKALKRGEVVVILPDQVPKTSNAIDAPFMGKEASTMLLIHKLLQKTQANILAGTAIRTPQGFEIHFLEVDKNIHSEDALTSASSLNHLIEKCIAIAPEQYQWEYNRFKKNS